MPDPADALDLDADALDDLAEKTDVNRLVEALNELDAKAWACDTMREVVSTARGIMGGNGILLEHDVARLFADAEGVFAYEGSREMNVLIVGRAITGQSAFV